MRHLGVLVEGRDGTRRGGPAGTGTGATASAFTSATLSRSWSLLLSAVLFALATSVCGPAIAATNPAIPNSTTTASAANERPASTSAPAAAQPAATLELGRRVLGRSLFEQGLGRDGREIGARMGAGEGLGLRGGAVACANCHGRDGRGGGEGWIRAPDLRWFALGRSHTRADGSQRPAYDARSLTRALRSGTGADAIALDSTMPRYDLAEDEIAALSSYLHALDEGQLPAAPRPSLLVLLPERDGGPAERLLEGWRNCPMPAAARGQKRPALNVLRYASIDEALGELARRERDGSVAALFAPYLIGVEAGFDPASLPADLPVLLPISLRGLEPATDRESRAAPVLFALPSQRLQSLALIRDAAPARAWSVYRAPEDAAARSQARRLLAELAGQGIAATEIDAIDPSSVDPLVLLSPLPPPAPGRAGNATGLELRLPAANMQLAAAQAWRERGARIRVAFAYPPRPAAAPSRWIGPEQAWTALGCELLARLPPIPASAAGLPAWRAQVAALAPLDLSGWFQLPARPQGEASLGRIELRDWPESESESAQAVPAR